MCPPFPPPRGSTGLSHKGGPGGGVLYTVQPSDVSGLSVWMDANRSLWRRDKDRTSSEEWGGRVRSGVVIDLFIIALTAAEYRSDVVGLIGFHADRPTDVYREKFYSNTATNQNMTWVFGRAMSKCCSAAPSVRYHAADIIGRVTSYACPPVWLTVWCF